MLLIVTLAGCGTERACSVRLIEAKQDLAGPLVAFRSVRSCPAKDEVLSIVAIGARNAGIAEATPVFEADSNRGEAEMEGDSVWLEMYWIAPHRLAIAYSDRARVLRSQASTQGASIAYRATHRLTRPPVP